jgi:DNA recombination protein RmuC
MDLTVTFLIVLVIGIVLLAVMQGVALSRTSAQSGTEQAVRDDLRIAREEAAVAGRELREEVRGLIREDAESNRRAFASMQNGFDGRMQTVERTIAEFGPLQQAAYERVRSAVDAGLKNITETTERKADEMRRDASASSKAVMELLAHQLQFVSAKVEALIESNQTAINSMRETIDARVKELQAGVEAKVTAMRAEVTLRLKDLDEHLARDLSVAKESQREYLDKHLLRLGEVGAALQSSLEAVRTTLDGRLMSLTQSNQEAFDRVTGAVNLGMTNIQASNEKRLEEMRATVDEKLQSTLEKRLGESFKLVSDRLEAVHRGLGEMQSLATGVGDLKRVLSNVKARGTWAEVQLGAILEQVLTPEQYAKNVATKPGSAERVEFAIKLPGPGDDSEKCVWLPIDSKFPQEDYVRLQEACEQADAEGQRQALEALIRAIRIAAKDISDKYVTPPHTTDFGIMFLPTEGLYAEVVRQGALIDELQQRFRVVVVGPSNLAAFLCSIRMGFQSIAIQRRADDVWKVLGAVKTEFGRFGGVLEKVRRQLETAARTVQDTQVRTRAMERNLRDVQALPDDHANSLLMLAAEAVAPLIDDTESTSPSSPPASAAKELTSESV